MSSDPLVRAFFEEAGELIADFEAGLLQLEDRPTDAELHNRIFRSAHTLKGNSSMLGFEEVAHFTHVLEDLLDQLRKGLKRPTPRLVDTLLSSVDVVRSLLARAEAESAPTADENATRERVFEALHTCLHGEESAEAPRSREGAKAGSPKEAPAPASGRTLYEIRFRPPADVFRRGMDPQQVIADLERLGELVQVRLGTEALPSLAEMDPEQSYLAWEIWLLSERSRTDVDACFEFIGDPAAVQITALPMGGDAPSADTPTPDREDAATGHAPADGEGRRVPAAAAAEAASIRVPVEKVDRLINLVGELVITQSMIAQAVSNFTAENLAALQEAVGQMDRHARELHERIMAVRMIPIKTLFGRFPRLVRDLTGTIGKNAGLETYGEDTELDKTVIEKIGDPLTHLVRNAVDHGLETPEERARAGKPDRGIVRLEAYQEGGSIYIEVADDGKGLDRERIVAKAIQNGLIGADLVLTDEEAFGLVFRPGLSTAEKVTEVSGRGVGMDVVKRNVEALGGTITIQSERGRGTTFRIKLPLTLAIMDGQTVCVGDQVYLLPLTTIVESIRPTQNTLSRVLGRGETVTVRGQVVPVIRLHDLFGVRPRTTELADALVVIVEHEGRLAAIGVDDLLGQQQVVIKSLEQNFERIEGVAGATILGDGRVALILDVPGLVALARAERSTGRIDPMAAAA
jgi:two-component system chemotaxis sensor kinase CheA